MSTIRRLFSRLRGGDAVLDARDAMELDALVDPDREVELSGPPTGYPDDFEVYPGVTFADLRRDDDVS